jgi:hypothetical protein
MSNKIPPAPLFRDPIYDGAADPTLIYNEAEQEWYMFYTNRRASVPSIKYGYVHGTDIGIATSPDGIHWLYRGTAQGLEFENGRNTFWAPEVIFAEGKYHMYCTYLKGVPIDWGVKKWIVHYTSDDLWNWHFESILNLPYDQVIDACVKEIAPKKWKMWYKVDSNAHTYTAYSDDLYNWTAGGCEIDDAPHEGPYVFTYNGYNWMIVDQWNGQRVYRSNNFSDWEYKNTILREGGTRTDDGFIGGHASVVVNGDNAYIFYFLHPERTPENCKQEIVHNEYRYRRTSIQVAQLEFDGETLQCDRNKEFELILR